jgi:hypothetical protein
MIKNFKNGAGREYWVCGTEPGHQERRVGEELRGLSGNPTTVLLATCLLAGLLNYSSTLKMEAIRSSETLGTTLRTTRRHIPEDDTLLIRLNL